MCRMLSLRRALFLKGDRHRLPFCLSVHLLLTGQRRPNLRVLTMFLLIAIAFLLKRFGTRAVPLRASSSTASTTFDEAIFARDDFSDECNGCTVLDILWSCLATNFACTWVSVHPNVPFRGESRWSILKRRIFLMFLSMLAPEVSTRKTTM